MGVEMCEVYGEAWTVPVKADDTARSLGMYSSSSRSSSVVGVRGDPALQQAPTLLLSRLQSTTIYHRRFGIQSDSGSWDRDDPSSQMATLVSTLDLQAPVPTQCPTPQTSVCIPFYPKLQEISTGAMDSISLLTFRRRAGLIRPPTAGRTHTTCDTEVFTRRGSCRSFGYRL